MGAQGHGAPWGNLGGARGNPGGGPGGTHGGAPGGTHGSVFIGILSFLAI